MSKILTTIVVCLAITSFSVKAGELEISSKSGKLHINVEANRHVVINSGGVSNNVITTLNGATGSRPTHDLMIGDQYFDVTLGNPIWVKSIHPTVWVNAAGKNV